jgi:DNA-binding transcriptional regulator YbjK
MPVAVKAEQEPRQGGTATRILRATLELIGREGIGALSNRRIAARAGVSLGSLTYHFPSQADLLRDSLELYVEEEVARLEAIAADVRARCTTLGEVAAEVQRHAAQSTERLGQIAEIELHLQAARDSALREASERCFAAYEGLAATALEALRVPEPKRRARGLVALTTGMAVRGMASGYDAAGLTEALVIFVRGAGAEVDL